MSEILEFIINNTITILQILSAVVIFYGGVVSFLRVIFQSLIREKPQRYVERTRIYLGRKLVIGLEFLIGADILRTVLSPTFERIGIAAAIIILRIILNYVLQKDIEHLEERLGESP